MSICTDPVGTSPAANAAAQATGDDAPTATPERVLLHMPVDVRSVSLAVLAVMGCIFMLQWAKAVFIPLLLGLIFSYALAPLVNRLETRWLPRALAAGLVVLTMLGAIGGAAYLLGDQATQFVESLPGAAQKIRQAARAKRYEPETAIEKVQKAATELENAAKESSATPPGAARGVTRVQIERPQFSINDYLLTSTPGMLAAAGQATVVVFITFFLLASGDSFRRKLVKLAGPTFARRKITVQVLDEITQQIQRYLLTQALISVIVGVATGLAYWALGVDQAAVWGVLAIALNFVPYIGSIAITGASALAGFVQFGSFDMALVLAGVSMALRTISGNLLTPWLTGRTGRINPVIVFVGVLVFGWVWGVWGLLLGTPVLLMLKAVCDRVDDLKPLGELLGR